MANYNAKKLVKRSLKIFIKQCVVDAITVGCYALIPFARKLTEISYYSWLILAVETAVAFLGVSIVINLLFYRKFVLGLPNIIKKRQ